MNEFPHKRAVRMYGRVIEYSYIHNPFVIIVLMRILIIYYKQRHNDYCYHLQTKGYYGHYLIHVLYHISIFYKSMNSVLFNFLIAK